MAETQALWLAIVVIHGAHRCGMGRVKPLKGTKQSAVR